MYSLGESINAFNSIVSFLLLGLVVALFVWDAYDRVVTYFKNKKK